MYLRQSRLRPAALLLMLSLLLQVMVLCTPAAAADLNDDAAAVRSGWQLENGSWYYYQEGARAAGWLQDGSAWYYLNSDGSMKTGWLSWHGGWYYLKADGSMKTGWLCWHGNWYYLKADGRMASGWLQDGSTWYYLKAGGAMLTGWLQWSSDWYWFDASGAMVTGKQTIDGQVSSFSDSGAWLEYWNGNGYMICIDPGHQSHPNYTKEAVGPGSSIVKSRTSAGTAGVATKAAESVLNLTVSLQLRDELESRGYTVVMTRTTQDVDLSNQERAQIANNCNADAFLRIHANGSSNHGASGTETLCQTSSNKWNKALYPQSYALSLNIVNGICAQTGSKNRGVITSDSYTGINWAQVPVTIVEMGYMSNYAEDRLMQTAAYQQKIVQGIANGLDAYFGLSG